MSVQGKNNRWIALIIVHLCKILFLLVAIVLDNSGNWYYFLSLRTWYLMFCFGDLTLFFAYWKMNPTWEEGARVFGIFWNIMIVVFLVYNFVFNFLIVLIIVETCVLILSKSYSDQQKKTNVTT